MDFACRLLLSCNRISKYLSPRGMCPTHSLLYPWSNVLGQSMKQKLAELLTKFFASLTVSVVDEQLFVVLQCWYKVFSINKENILDIFITVFVLPLRLPSSSAINKITQLYWLGLMHGRSLLCFGASWGGKNGCDKMNNGRTPSAVILAWLWTTVSLAVLYQHTCSNFFKCANHDRFS